MTSDFGRVDADGTVYVRVGDQEHVVGQYPEGTADEAMAFFTKRYDALAFEVHLLEQRVRSGAMSPDEATSTPVERTSSTVPASTLATYGLAFRGEYSIATRFIPATRLATPASRSCQRR